MPTDEIRLWAMDGSGDVVRLESADRTPTEQMLEEMLVKHPDILMEGLTLVGRQTPTEGGPLDLLGVDADGRLVVFELKRGTLSREAVAQVIDYASYLGSMPNEKLARYISERSGSRSVEKGVERIEDFEEWYGSRFEELSGLKPVRMVLVGLGVDERTTRMVRFLADGGMDFSILTFQGYTHAGKTLLARQIQVEANPEPEGTTPPRRPGRRERREALEQRIDEHERRQEARELWEAVLGMFRENFPGCREVAAGGRANPSTGRLNFRKPGARGRAAAMQLGPYGPHPALVSLLFFSRSVRLCLDEFVKLRKEVDYLTYPRFSPERETAAIELEFPFNSLAEWETHKNKLAAVHSFSIQSARSWRGRR